MKFTSAWILIVAVSASLWAQEFDPTDWTAYHTLRVDEPTGLARDKEPVDVGFQINGSFDPATISLRLVSVRDGGLHEIATQFYALARAKTGVSGRLAFLCTIPANASQSYRLYFGHRSAGRGQYQRKLTVRTAEKGPIEGPMHWMIENDAYRIETYPKNGQIWHIWNKKGADKMWWFKEWNGLEKGGDPVDWSPNAWVAYPDRINKAEHEPVDWHYVVGWVEPKTEIVDGPVFYEIKRSGPVKPHPDRANARFERTPGDKVWAQVTYRFYADLPWYYQASKMNTLADLHVYFIRNSQMVFNYTFFSHLALRPQSAALREGDCDETAVLPLMSYFNRAPFATDHTLSNVLPSKISFYSLFNPETRDGYANFQLRERNSTTSGVEPIMTNHALSLTDRHGWVVYLSRIFNYTNLRFNPENAVFLPKGQLFEDENVHLIYRYESPADIHQLEQLEQTFRHPLTAAWQD